MQSASGQAIVLGDQNDTLTNKAQIMGGVSMGGGDDALNVYTGSTISGAIDLGAGNDTVHLLGAGESFGAVAHAENLDVDQVSGPSPPPVITRPSTSLPEQRWRT